MRMLPLAILCALLGLTYWVGATALTNTIEQDIETRTNAAIKPYQNTVDLVVDGRDVTLTGKVPDAQTRKEALHQVDSVFGVRATRDSLSLMEAFDLYANFQNGQNLSSKGTVDDLTLSAIKRHFTPPSDYSELQTDAQPLPLGAEKIALASDAIAKMDQAELWMDKDQLKITGSAPDQQTKTEIEQGLQNQSDLIDPLKLLTDISVPILQLASAPEQSYCLPTDGIQAENFVNEVLLFAVDSDVVEPDYHQTVQQFADRYRECINTAQATVIIEAHADHDGSENYNFELSQRRANNVVSLLASFGLNAAQLETFAYGETRPVASNEATTEKSYNRRVEVRYISDSSTQQFFSTNSAE